MKASLNLCLLFSLISPVVLLTCEHCANPIGTECVFARDERCTKGSSCRSSIFNSNVFLNTTERFKSCFYSPQCQPGHYSLTTSGGGFLDMYVDCCKTKMCNTKPLEFPSEPMQPNGLECEGCHVEDERTCEGTEMVKCLGDQTKCISMEILFGYSYGEKIARIFTAKGCATPLMCNENKVDNNMVFKNAFVARLTVNCTDSIIPYTVSSLA